MASPMPETVMISVEEYGNLLMTKESADYVYGIVYWMSNQVGEMVSAQEFASNLLSEWTK